MYVFNIIFFSAIIVTGDTDTGSSSRTAEVLKEDGSSLCTLPDLPDDRAGHTQSGLVLCGGYYTSTSCYTFSNRSWHLSHSLIHPRYDHTSWTSPLGVILLGGSGSGTTMEVLTDGGQSTELFPLKYNT